MRKFLQVKWAQARRRKTIWFSMLVICIFTLIAAFAPWIAPHDPYQWGLSQSLLPPMWVQPAYNPGRAEYPLGTDRYGRDILSRQIYGARTAIFLALTAVPLAALVGTLAGLVAGYSAGGRLDAAIMFVVDMIQSLPGIMFMVIIALLFRSKMDPTWLNGMLTLMIGFTAINWVSLARLIRVNVLQIKSQLFMEAAVSIGATPRRIIAKHLMPNVQHVILVWFINNIPAVILLEVVLGYIGVSVTSAVDGGEFNVVSWGGIFFSGRSVMSSNPLMLIVPSVAILLLSMSFFILGDFLNETTPQD